MPRRSILSATERKSLLALPDAKDDLIRLYTFNDADLSRIRQHRGAANLPNEVRYSIIREVRRLKDLHEKNPCADNATDGRADQAA